MFDRFCNAMDIAEYFHSNSHGRKQRAYPKGAVLRNLIDRSNGLEEARSLLNSDGVTPAFAGAVAQWWFAGSEEQASEWVNQVWGHYYQEDAKCLKVA